MSVCMFDKTTSDDRSDNGHSAGLEPHTADSVFGGHDTFILKPVYGSLPYPTYELNSGLIANITLNWRLSPP